MVLFGYNTTPCQDTLGKIAYNISSVGDSVIITTINLHKPKGEVYANISWNRYGVFAVEGMPVVHLDRQIYRLYLNVKKYRSNTIWYDIGSDEAHIFLEVDKVKMTVSKFAGHDSEGQPIYRVVYNY